MKTNYFSNHKSKVYGISSVALASLLLTTGNVYANEATNNQDTSNVVNTSENKENNYGLKDPNPTVDLTATTGKGSYTIDLKEETKTSTETNTSVEWKPMDLVAILDFSGSTTGDTNTGSLPEKENYRMFMYKSLKALIEKDLTDDSYVQIAFYGGNETESYQANEIPQGKSQLSSTSTNLISKQDAIKLLDSLIKQNAKDLSSVLIIARNYLYDQNAGLTPFENIYKEQKKNELVSVIQFTDEWNDDEEIDTSFADWAKSNAKTFMSVLFKDTAAYSTTIGADGPKFNGKYAKSKRAMEAAGHPNIYIWNEQGKDSKSEQQVQDDVIKTFENTAVEKSETKTTTTTTKPKFYFNISIKDAKLKKVILTKPDGTKQELEIKLNGDLAEFPETEVPAGKYQIDWEAESNNGGSVQTLAFNNGNEILKDVKEIKGQSSVFLVIVDENGKEIKRHRVAVGEVGKEYKIQAPTVGENATIELISGELNGKVTSADKEVVFKIAPKQEEKSGKVIARFVDENGKEIMKEVIVAYEGLLNDDWSYKNNMATIEFEGKTYILKQSPEVLEGKKSKEDIILTFVYEEKKEAPKPSENKPVESKKEETPSPKELPKTGEINTASMSLLGLGLLSAMGATTLKKKKEN